MLAAELEVVIFVQSLYNRNSGIRSRIKRLNDHGCIPSIADFLVVSYSGLHQMIH